MPPIGAPMGGGGGAPKPAGGGGGAIPGGGGGAPKPGGPEGAPKPGGPGGGGGGPKPCEPKPAGAGGGPKPGGGGGGGPNPPSPKPGGGGGGPNPPSPKPGGGGGGPNPGGGGGAPPKAGGGGGGPPKAGGGPGGPMGDAQNRAVLVSGSRGRAATRTDHVHPSLDDRAPGFAGRRPLAPGAYRARSAADQEEVREFTRLQGGGCARRQRARALPAPLGSGPLCSGLQSFASRTRAALPARFRR